MESVNPEFAPSHRIIECGRTDTVFFSYLPDVSTGYVALDSRIFTMSACKHIKIQFR